MAIRRERVLYPWTGSSLPSGKEEERKTDGVRWTKTP